MSMRNMHGLTNNHCTIMRYWTIDKVVDVDALMALSSHHFLIMSMRIRHGLTNKHRTKRKIDNMRYVVINMVVMVCVRGIPRM